MKIKRHVRRFDLGEVQSVTRTPQGFLMCPGFATRCGVFPYLRSDGKIVRELRHPDDVLDPVSLATLRNAPVTVEHPPTMVNPKNVALYRKGHTTNRVEVNRDLVETDLIIEDQEAIDAVERDGLRELSSGYDCDVVPESGDFNGAPYDFRQKNIVYNHVALVKRGRAGPEVRLRMDSADAVMQPEVGTTFATETTVTDSADPVVFKKVVFLGREVDLPSDVADAFQDMLDRYDEIRAKQSMMEDSMKKVRNDVDVNQAGISPQVKVEQQTPDGVAAPGKTAPAPGTITGPVGKEDADEENMDGEDEKEGKKDADKDEKKDGDKEEKGDDEGGKEKGEGSSESNVDRMKKDMDEKQAKHDAEMSEMKKKMDAFASASDDQKGKGKMDSADVNAKIRARVKLERQAEKLVPFEVSKRFDSMSDVQVMGAVIKHRVPKADLAGKSSVYIQSRFDSIVEAIAEEGSEKRSSAGRALMGVAGGGRFDAAQTADPSTARQKMISDTRELYKQPLSASKK